MALFTVKFKASGKESRLIKADDYQRDEHGFTNFKDIQGKTIESLRTEEIAEIKRS